MRTPCQQGDPEQWFSVDPHERLNAMRDCLTCPIWKACGDGAQERGERHGVWGARDFTPKKGPTNIAHPKRCPGCGAWFLPRVGEQSSKFAERKYHDNSCASKYSRRRAA